MAEILIKNMEMPKHLKECPMRNTCPLMMGCMLIEKGEIIHPDCPLVELPPHGRLIDADELPVSYPSVVNAQTVIPASDDYDETIDCTTCKNYEGCEVLIDEDEPIVGCTGFERK